MSRNDTTLIIDLDGTLVDCNSFTEFVKFLFMRLPMERWKIFAIVIKRKLRLITHHEAKRRIVRIAAKSLTDTDLKDFVQKLKSHIRPSMLRLVETSGRVILATAAPDIYVIPFAGSIGIEEFTATKENGSENRGMVKLRNVERLGVTFDSDTMVVTDHYDDLPLLKRNSMGRNILIRPGAATEMHLNMAGIVYTAEK